MNKITQMATVQRRPKPQPAPTSPRPAARAHVTPLVPAFGHNPVGQVLRALAQQRCHVAYQPIFRACDLTLVSAEALIRLADHAGEPVSPCKFMQALEASNAIAAVTGFVLETTCRDLAQWRRDYPEMHASINVSVTDLNRTSFVSELLESQTVHDLPVDAVEIEVVERASVEPGSVADRNLHEMARIGVPVSIDDFGQDFADATRLAQMPASKLKLDRSFLRNARSPHVWRWVKALVDHAQRRGLEVVAEGVETDEELEVAVGLGCDYLQGFLLGTPRPAAYIPPYFRCASLP